MDFINLRGFSPETTYWLKEEFAIKYDFPLDGTFISFETACALFFLLRQCPDEEFPRGKWATIQLLEGWLDKMAKEVFQAPPAGSPGSEEE